MSEHESMDPTERSELAERMAWLGRQNAQAVEELRATGRAVSPLELLDLKLTTMLDLAFGPVPRVSSVEELAERITDARLVFEVEWQGRLHTALEQARKKKGDLLVPKSNGKIHLP